MGIETKVEPMSDEMIQSLRDKSSDDCDKLTDEQREQLAREKLERLKRAAQLNTFLVTLNREINPREMTISDDLVNTLKLASSVARQATFWSYEDVKTLNLKNSRSSADEIMSGQVILRDTHIAVTSIPTRVSRVEIVKFLTSISSDLQAVEYEMNWITPPWLSTKR